MSELKAIWNQLKEDTNQLTDFSSAEIRAIISKKSQGSMEKLANKILNKFILCIILTVAIACYIPFASPLPSQVLLMIMFATYLLGCMLLFQEYRELKKKLDPTLQPLENMKLFYKRVKKVIRYEELISLAIYPISAPAGFMVGMVAASENDSYLTKPSHWIAMIVTMIVVVPLADLLTKWMNRRTFGKYLKRLEQNIHELEGIENN